MKLCDICGGIIEDNGSGDYDKNGKWTGKIVCKKCYNTKYTYGKYERPIKKSYNPADKCDECGKSFDKKCGIRGIKEYKTVFLQETYCAKNVIINILKIVMI